MLADINISDASGGFGWEGDAWFCSLSNTYVHGEDVSGIVWGGSGQIILPDGLSVCSEGVWIQTRFAEIIIFPGDGQIVRVQSPKQPARNPTVRTASLLPTVISCW